MTVLMQNPNFLILDEPTNDLDIFVMSVLEDYLRSFEGCLIVVSHDRYFMDKMVDHIFVFKGGGEIKDITGNYTEYRKLQKVIEREEKNVEKEEKPAVIEKKEEPSPDKRKLTYKEQQEFKSLEKALEKLEDEKGLLTQKLSNPSLASEELMEAGEMLGKVVAELDEKTDRWLELSEYV
jgi:ATP-binding cassette subfamily F protein uup